MIDMITRICYNTRVNNVHLEEELLGLLGA